MAYIYLIKNNINNKCYIGKTEYSIEKRFREHCTDAYRENTQNRPLYQAIKKYGASNFSIEILEETDKPEEREIYWIKEKNTYGSNGYNATLGGDGKKYIDHEQVIEEYKKIGVIIDVANKLNIHRDTVRNILVANNINIVSSSEIIKEKYAISVDMFDLSNNYIQTFISLNEAARYMVDNNLTGCKLTTIKQHIKEVCSGKRKTAAKFIWKYHY